jgi:hypothetical protein
MRTLFPHAYDPESRPIDPGPIPTDSRHELLPILVALQLLYSSSEYLQQIVELLKAAFRTDQPHRGRPGFSYWEIIVLAAVRLGCNLTYDALQDLAQSHHILRLIMGLDPLASSSVRSEYRWHRIRDNLCRLRPKTLKAINHLIVKLAHEQLDPKFFRLRGEAFVVETNIHYPTESSLLGDGLRKICELLRKLIKVSGVPNHFPEKYYQKQIKRLLRRINSISRSKKADASQRLKQAYAKLYALTKKLLARAEEIKTSVTAAPEPSSGIMNPLGVGNVLKSLDEFLKKTRQVLGYSQRRVLGNEKIANEEKLFSMFESHTQLVNRGKQPQPVQLGRVVNLLEDNYGFVTDYEGVDREKPESEGLGARMQGAKKRLGKPIESVSFDRGFHTHENQRELQGVAGTVCIPESGSKDQDRRETDECYAKARKYHAGVESLVGSLQSGKGLKRCRDRGEQGFKR